MISNFSVYKLEIKYRVSNTIIMVSYGIEKIMVSIQLKKMNKSHLNTLGYSH